MPWSQLVRLLYLWKCVAQDGWTVELDEKGFALHHVTYRSETIHGLRDLKHFLRRYEDSR